MKRCLVINPNMTAAVTDALVSACARAQPALQWHGVTAGTGVPYISDEVGYARGACAALDAFEDHFAQHDAILVACFGDPGLLALRQRAPVPVLGLASASFAAAARRGRFAVVTGGPAWVPMLQRFARAHRLDERLVAIRAIDWTGARIAADPSGAHDALLAAARDSLDDGAEVVLLGGAALAGMAAVLQPRLPVPLLDNVLLAAQAVADVLA